MSFSYDAYTGRIPDGIECRYGQLQRYILYVVSGYKKNIILYCPSKVG